MPVATEDPLREPRKKYKVCLAGDAAVGKTSLIRRFVHDEFDDRYVTTLGAKVTKKVLEAEIPETGEVDQVALMIWDIMGQPGIRELLREAYFYGAQGVLLVCDVTQRHTLEGLDAWRSAIDQVTGRVPTYLVANKVDLKAAAVVTEGDLRSRAEELGCPFVLGSAKTGEGVEEAFQGLAERILRHGLDKT